MILQHTKFTGTYFVVKLYVRHVQVHMHTAVISFLSRIDNHLYPSYWYNILIENYL